METQKNKCPDTREKVEGAAQMNEQAHCNRFLRPSNAVKILACFCTEMILLFTAWLVAIHLVKVIYG